MNLVEQIKNIDLSAYPYAINIFGSVYYFKNMDDVQTAIIESLYWREAESCKLLHYKWIPSVEKLIVEFMGEDYHEVDTSRFKLMCGVEYIGRSYIKYSTDDILLISNNEQDVNEFNILVDQYARLVFVATAPWRDIISEYVHVMGKFRDDIIELTSPKDSLDWYKYQPVGFVNFAHHPFWDKWRAKQIKFNTLSEFNQSVRDEILHTRNDHITNPPPPEIQISPSDADQPLFACIIGLMITLIIGLVLHAILT